MKKENEVSEFVRQIANGDIQWKIEIPTGVSYVKYGTNEELDKLVDSPQSQDRIKAALMGYGLDKLINDCDEGVNNAVWEYIDK